MSRCSTFCHNHFLLKLTAACRSSASFAELSALPGLPRLVCLPALDVSLSSSSLPHRVRCPRLLRTCACASQGTQASLRHGTTCFSLHAR